MKKPKTAPAEWISDVYAVYRITWWVLNHFSPENIGVDKKVTHHEPTTTLVVMPRYSSLQYIAQRLKEARSEGKDIQVIDIQYQGDVHILDLGEGHAPLSVLSAGVEN